MRNWSELMVLLGFVVIVNPASAAPLVWNGPPTTFTKANFADRTLPQNQDRLTDNVWITRGNTQGLFNIRQESGFTHGVSPTGTEWAFGSAADWPSLAFTDWETWSSNHPPSVLNRDAVLHLITDDIYLDIRFLSWTEFNSGGGFSYERSTAVPEPASAVLAGTGIAGLLLRRRRKIFLAE